MKRKQKRSNAHVEPPLVVATAHTPRGLQIASRTSRNDADIVEIRLDCLADHLELLAKTLPRINRPLLLTARHPREGGAMGLPRDFRHAALHRFFPLASAVDVELRSVPEMQDIVEAVRDKRKTLVLSFHDFHRTPSTKVLRNKVSAARRAGADIVKIATTLHTPRDLAKLLLLQASSGNLRLATMGMGTLGRVSRLVLAAAGSRLNYGFLDRPQVAGQWPAAELRALIHELGS